jgi:DNA-binding response OmpR family regulator
MFQGKLWVAPESRMTLQSASPGPLLGRRVLVIEDEYFLADDIERTLSALGARVLGPFGELKEATDLVDRDIAIDAAVVDINLRNEMVFPLARILRARKVPFVFTTGYDSSSVDVEFQDVRVWEKPLDIAAMARELTSMIKSE